jgi:predicted metal-dependent hydrolase
VPLRGVLAGRSAVVSSTPGASVRLGRLDTVDVRWSPRARRWRLEVPWGEAPRLTVPVGTSHAQVRRLLAEKERWIVQQQDRQIPRLGLENCAISESEARVAARETISALAEEEAKRIGVTFERIRIGGQRTLWGSCSPRATLSFNWRLVLAPLEVLDYVVVHELCHLRVPNHSRQFWALVGRWRPGWRDPRHWLRIHGPELLAFAPQDAKSRPTTKGSP